MSGEGRPWERREGESNLWYGRFRDYYLPLGSDRKLLPAYRAWFEAEKGRESQAKSAPTSWRKAAQKYDWEIRGADWDAYQRSLREREERELRRKSHEKRVALLNATYAQAVAALQGLRPSEARWSDVTNTIRMVVQELRREYGDDGVSSPNGAPPALSENEVPFAAVVAALQKAKGTRVIGSDDDAKDKR